MRHKLLEHNNNAVAHEVMDILDVVGGFAFVAGGAARYIVDRNENPLEYVAPWPSDIDLFLHEARGFHPALTGMTAFGYTNPRNSGNAILLDPPEDRQLPAQVVYPQIQGSTRTFGRPEEVLAQFGYTTEMAAVHGPDDDGAYWLLYDERMLPDTHASRLTINTITCPVALAWRAVKYGRKGYYMSIRDVARLFEDWEARPAEWRRETLATLHKEEVTAQDLYRLLGID